MATSTPAHAIERCVSNTWALGCYDEVGYTIEACDKNADGRRSGTSIDSSDGYTEVFDTDGANNGCTGESAWFAAPFPGTIYTLRAWRQNGNYGSQENPVQGTYTAS